MPTGAGQDLIVAGLQASHCLCLSGVHVLTPTIMKLLADELQNTSTGQSIHLSSALNTLAGGTMPIRIRRSLLGGWMLGGMAGGMGGFLIRR